MFVCKFTTCSHNFYAIVTYILHALFLWLLIKSLSVLVGFTVTACTVEHVHVLTSHPLCWLGIYW